MADGASSSELRSFLNTITTHLDSYGEEELLETYYLMQSYEGLRAYITRYDKQILTAITEHRPLELVGLLRKIEADFTRSLSEEVVQQRDTKERSTPEYETQQDELVARANDAIKSLEGVGPVSQSIAQSRQKTNRAFISRLVKRYSSLSPEQQAALVDAIIRESELHPSAPVERILQQAVAVVVPDEKTAAAIVGDKEMAPWVTDAQTSSPEVIEQQIATIIIHSPDPQVAKNTIIEGIRPTDDIPTPLETIFRQAEMVSKASAVVNSVSASSEPDYAGFFTSLAQSGGPIEKAVAPIADVFFTLFPSDTKQAIAISVMSSLWKKDTQQNGVVQSALGNLFQSETVARAIQKGNSVFSTTSKGGVITPTQSFIGDVITTVFRPNTTTMWTEMVRVDTKILPQTAYQYYLTVLTRSGSEKVVKIISSRASKKAAAEVGKAVASKITSKTLGQTIGGALGTFLVGVGIPPGVANAIGAWIGGKLFEAAGGIFSKAVGVVKNLSNYVAGSWFEDYGLVMGLVLIFIIFGSSLFPPLDSINSIFPFFSGAGHQETVTSTAYIQGLGEAEAQGPTLDCLGADKDNPACDMTPCDPTNPQNMGCKWPANGFIYQGPQTGGSCPGTHGGAQAIDIDPIGGSGPLGGPVYSTVNGTVAKVNFGCATGSGCSGCTCANYIILQGPGYSVGYWHLANTQMVKVGDPVTVGQVIGTMDHTGHSTGTHLHYQYWGPGSINSILPVSVPTCNNYNANCKCPYISTGVTP